MLIHSAGQDHGLGCLRVVCGLHRYPCAKMRLHIGASCLKSREVLAVFCIILVAFTTGCPSKNRDDGKASRVRKVHLGDPLNVVRGTVNKPELDGQDLAYLRSLKDFYLISSIYFDKESDYDESSVVNNKTVEEEAAPTQKSSDEEEQYSRYNIRDNNKAGFIEFSEVLDVGSAQDRYSFRIYTDEPLIAIRGSRPAIRGRRMEVFENDIKVENMLLLHFSKSQDGNYFSLLTVGLDDKHEASTVYALYFANGIDNNYKTIDEKYNYYLGPGVQIGWNTGQLINIDICGANVPEKGLAEIRSAIDQWAQALAPQFKNDKALLKLNVRELKSNYKPFTDFDQHCVYIIDDFLAKPNPKVAEYGVTATIADSHSVRIQDSDILIFSKEFNKQGASIWDEKSNLDRQFVFAHEMGHFLGLDHQFNPDIKSIMSYEFTDSRLQKYDFDAIRALYSN